MAVDPNIFLKTGLLIDIPKAVADREAQLSAAYNDFVKAMSITKPSVSNIDTVSVIYQPDKKQWKATEEKTDFKTDFPIEGKQDQNLKVVRNEQLVTKRAKNSINADIYIRFDVVDSNGNVINKGTTVGYDAYLKDGEYRVARGTDKFIEKQEARSELIKDYKVAMAGVENKYVDKRNNISKDYNEKGEQLNKQNTAKNAVYGNLINTIAKNTKGSDYVTRRDNLEKLKTTLTNAGINNQDANSIISKLTGEYKNFYRTEKLKQWDLNLGSKPPYGSFNPSYYSGISPGAETTWTNAVNNDDIDVTERYGNKNGFMLYHYTTVGKPAGVRGNEAEITEQANAYLEKAPTDQDLQAVRDYQLGIKDNQTERLLAVPEIAEQWEAARGGDPYWKELAKQNFLDIEDPDQFAALFRLSNRDEDKQIKFNLNLNAGYGITELENAVTEAVGERATVDVKRFGALTQNVLKDTIEEMKKAKAREQELDLFRGFGGFDEIVNINEELSNSILGDSGVGGVLAFTSGGKAEDDLKKALGNVTGVGNNVKYNWQNWFENELQEKYKGDLELGYTQEETEKEIAIQAEFAKNFIDNYLVPRFDTSRSMDEFVEYLDVRQEEQNPFQTQDLVNAVKQVAQLRSDSYLDELRDTTGRSFNADFYFDPTGDDARTAEYAAQKEEVSSDWDKARFGTPEEKAYWAKQAYRFGLDINDKESFAKIHFQVKGQGQGYDAADDILNATKVKNKIYDDILPALEEEALQQGTVFGQFITPEEFADDLLIGIDPEDDERIDEVLKSVGLESFSGSIDELKEYIAEALRTGSAQTIRENIKYLNEQRKRPTQEKLGITYIEREEDYEPDKVKAETQLYKVFSNAGYKGTEDEFYEKFFPDTSRSEQILLTKGGSGTGLEMVDIDYSDPFAAFGSVQGLLGDEEEERQESDEEDRKSFFSLNLDDDDDEDYKSKRGQEILGEFTSIFKGF